MTLKWIPQITPKYCALLLTFVLPLAVANNAMACEPAAKTPLEKLYCQVQAKGEGASLPSFDDFRRNSPQTQRLLLKRPAQRADLALPEPEPEPKPKASSSKTLVLKNNPPPANASKPQAVPSAKKPLKLEQANAKVLTSLRHCSVGDGAVNGTKKGFIQCGNKHYTLLDNLPNKKLSPNALTPANSLNFAPVPAGFSLHHSSSTYGSNADLHNYLQSAYGLYLRKMHSIGLAGATLTYSKFYYIFWDGRSQKQDFVKRFSDMFTYLKKDKSTIAVAPRHKKKLPPSLANCQPINADQAAFIVCDQKGVNWVYQLVL